MVGYFSCGGTIVNNLLVYMYNKSLFNGVFNGVNYLDYRLTILCSRDENPY